VVDKTAQAAAADAYSIKHTTDDDPLDAQDATADALKVVLDGINGGLPLSLLMATVYTDLLVNGNCYLRIYRLPDGMPASIKRVDYRSIVPHLDVDSGELTGFDLFSGGNYHLAPTPIAKDDIIHIPLNEMGEAGTGLSRLEALDNTLSLDMGAVAVNIGYMQNGTKAGDVFTFNPETMDENAIERERQYLMDNFSKPSQSYSPMFLAGDIKLAKPGTAGKNDMDFHKLREFNREEVASVYHMPLSLLSTAVVGALGSNGKEQDLLMWNNDTIDPLQKRAFLFLTDKLIQGMLGLTQYKLAPPTNAGLRLEAIQIADGLIRVGGTGNDARKVLNLPEIDGLDDPLFIAQRGQTIIGIPGSDDSAIVTPTGVFSGAIQPIPTQDSGAENADTGQGQQPSAAASSAKSTSTSKDTTKPGNAPSKVPAEQRKRKAEPGTVTASAAPSQSAVDRISRAYAAYTGDEDSDLWQHLAAHTPTPGTETA
jgi:HK97 family phage portal protein